MPGSEMLHVDFLSRYVEPPETDVDDRMFCFPIVNIPLPTLEAVCAAQKREPPAGGRGYVCRDGVFYYCNGVFVPSSLRNKVISACHNIFPRYHVGTKKTKSTILRVFNWPGLHQDVASFVKSCLVCQRLRPGLERLQGLFRRHASVGPFENVYMDFWGPFHFKGSRNLVLTMIDNATKWCECVVVPSKAATHVADAFLTRWICRFGVPKTVMTDQDTSFMSEVMTLLCVRMGITHLRSTIYHPDGNSPIETFHRTLKRGLSYFDMDCKDQTPFPIALELCCMAYRATLHTTLGDSPAFTTYGVDMRPARENDWRFIRDGVSEKSRAEFLSIMRLDMMYQAFLRDEWARQAPQPHRKPMKFTMGDLVLIQLSPFQLSELARVHGNRKFTPKWSIPHRVVRVFPGNSKALCKNLLTGALREAHITQVRFILLPSSPEQEAEWNVFLQDALDAYDVNDRHTIITKFWQQAKFIQEEDGLRNKKRKLNM
jgi:transposase InsO family protein